MRGIQMGLAERTDVYLVAFLRDTGVSLGADGDISPTLMRQIARDIGLSIDELLAGPARH